MSIELNHVLQYGEAFRVLRDPPVLTNASIKRSTNASFSPSLRESSWQGTIPAAVDLRSGEYMERLGDVENGGPPVFLVCSVNIYPHAPDLCEAFILKSNVRAAIYRKSGEPAQDTETGVWNQAWGLMHKDIPAYMEIVTRSMNKLNAGLKDQSIYNIDLPKSFGLQPLDRLVVVDPALGIVFPEALPSGSHTLSDFTYQADSINYASYVGLTHAQLDRDIRE